MDDILQRRGTFKISHYAINKTPDMVCQILAGCLIVRAESIYDSYESCIEYCAYCPAFEAVPPQCMANEYECQISQHYDEDSGEETFTHEWIKIER